MSVPLPSEMCQFCLSNGENLEQCRSHQLKSASGLVSCPILRAFTCPSCGATGDHAHTPRYCPTNKNVGVKGCLLTELKKKKNAAGRIGKSRWFPPASPPYHPMSSKSSGHLLSSKKSEDLLSSKAPGYQLSSKYSEDLLSSKAPGYQLSSKYSEQLLPSKSPGHLLSTKSLPPAVPLKTPLLSSIVPDKTLMSQHMSWEPACYQLSLYKHYQWIQFYREKCLHHQAEISRLIAQKRETSFFRTFNPAPTTPGGLLSTDIWCQEGQAHHYSADMMKEEFCGDTVEMMQNLQLDQMLADLREGSVEFND